MRKSIPKLRIGDFILIGILIILPVFYIFKKDVRSKSNVCVIKTPYREVLIRLPSDTVIIVEGLINKSRIKIEGDSVRMEYSPCPKKYCMKMGWIKNRNEEIICIPNGIIIKMQAEDIDGITQ